MLTLVRRARTTVNILFFCICLLGVFLYTDILILFHTQSAETALFVSRVDHIFVVYTIPVFIHFFHAYLGIRRRKWLLVAAYSYAACLMFLSWTPLCVATMVFYPFGFYGRGGPLYALIGMGAAFAVAYCILLLLISIRREKSSIQKNKLKYILIGFGSLGVLNGLNVLPLLGYPIYPPGAFSFIPLLLFGVGLFKYDLLDMGLVIQKSLLVSITTAVFTGMYALIITWVTDALRLSRADDSFLFSMGAFFIFVMIFGPAQSGFQSGLALLIQNRKLNFHAAVKRISRRIASSLELNVICRQLVTGLVDDLKIEHARVLVEIEKSNGRQLIGISKHKNGERDHEAMWRNTAPLLTDFFKGNASAVQKKRLLEKEDRLFEKQALMKMEALAAEVILPLKIKDRCLGLIILGEKISGHLYHPEEIDLLVTLSVQMSLAVANSNAYNKLDELNKTLEKRVMERTRDLQAALLEKEKSQEQLIRSESLAALGQLVAGVAHELNNPLSAAMSLIQSTGEDFEALHSESQRLFCDAMQADIEFAQKELKRAKQIVESLLGLSRQTNTYTEVVDLNQVVRHAVKVLESTIKHHHIRVEQTYEANLPVILGNFANLGQVAINIIQNACQAVKAGGSIFVSTRYLNGSDPSTGNQVLFSCRDQGPGIPTSIRNDIFKPFFTTKPVGQGTGLGLYLCHEIIRKHRGSIVCESTQDHGARFKVYLPVPSDLQRPTS
ncbi:MAG: ATP-binding protein [Deltaproteobacteria bacterium]